MTTRSQLAPKRVHVIVSVADQHRSLPLTNRREAERKAAEWNRKGLGGTDHEVVTYVREDD